MGAFDLFVLSPQQFLVVFALATAVIAMWLHMRFPDYGPGSYSGVTVHLVVAVIGANVLVPAAFKLASSTPEVLVATFGVALPLVTYMFLSGIWLIRLGQGLLGRYSR